MKRLLLLSSVVWASAASADAIDVQVKNRAAMGQGYPEVHLAILEPIAGFRLQLKRSNGEKIDVKGGGKPGVVRVIDLTQPEGTFSYEGTLTINLPNGTQASMPLKFDASLFGPLRMTVDEKKLDLEHQSLELSLNHYAGKAQLRVIMDTGDVAFDGEIPFNGEAPGTPLKVTWPKAPGKVLTIALKAFDTETFFTGTELSPWSYDVPHDELNFDTGKWDIRPSEQGKLDKAASTIRDVVMKVGRHVDLKLYVAGCTDTVGDKAMNKTLSLNRAKSIANYFRKEGIRLPIFFDGFGEDALLVGTPDETDEQQNRRAMYIVSVNLPNLKGLSVTPRWQKL